MQNFLSFCNAINYQGNTIGKITQIFQMNADVFYLFSFIRTHKVKLKLVSTH